MSIKVQAFSFRKHIWNASLIFYMDFKTWQFVVSCNNCRPSGRYNTILCPTLPYIKFGTYKCILNFPDVAGYWCMFTKILEKGANWVLNDHHLIQFEVWAASLTLHTHVATTELCITRRMGFGPGNKMVDSTCRMVLGLKVFENISISDFIFTTGVFRVLRKVNPPCYFVSVFSRVYVADVV